MDSATTGAHDVEFLAGICIPSESSRNWSFTLLLQCNSKQLTPMDLQSLGTVAHLGSWPETRQPTIPTLDHAMIEGWRGIRRAPLLRFGGVSILQDLGWDA
jgi:hypothetical protein